MINQLSEDWIRDMSAFGGIVFYSFVTATALVCGLYQIFYRLFTGLIIILLVIFLIRHFYFKERPIKRKKGDSTLSQLDASSFPSVHAARISLISAAFLAVSSTLFLLGILLMLGVDYSRLKTKSHYLADVACGNAIGYLLGYVLFFVI